VVRLPAKSLRYTAIAPNLLVVRRAAPADAVRFVDVGVLPESADASRALARALLANEDISPYTVRTVAVAELLKADARLVASGALEARGDDRLEAITAAVDMRPLDEVAALTAGVSVRRETITENAAPGVIPLVRVGDLTEGVLRLGERFLRADVEADV